MLSLLFALLGFISIILGCFSLRQCRRFAVSPNKPPYWRFLRITVLLLAIFMGLSQLDGIRYVPGYTVHAGRQEFTVVGFPFLVVVFDRDGNDFFSPFVSPLAMLGNAVFWFMVPHFFLSFYIRRTSLRQSGQETVPAEENELSK